jgi:glycosyltransferase involved in cell wall biosynthesis
LEAEASLLPCEVSIVRVPTPFDGKSFTYRRYLSWLLAASTVVRKRSATAEIFHHATFASDWMFPPVLFGLARKTRFVWGPAGGNTYPPFSLLRGLKLAFVAKETLRLLSTKSIRFLVRTVLCGRVDVFIALNKDSGRSAPVGASVLYHSNCVLPYDEYPHPQARQVQKTVLFVGRLIDLKGLFLVQAAFEELGADWRLEILGDGPLRKELESWATGFGDRVLLHGKVDHSAIMEHMAQANVLLFPGLHDTAPWASAEAAAAGLPVVCLDLGGVAQMAGENAVVVAVEPVTDLGRRLARAVESASHLDVQPQKTWTMEKMVALLDQAYSSSTDPVRSH